MICRWCEANVPDDLGTVRHEGSIEEGGVYEVRIFRCPECGRRCEYPEDEEDLDDGPTMHGTEDIPEDDEPSDAEPEDLCDGPWEAEE